MPRLIVAMEAQMRCTCDVSESNVRTHMLRFPDSSREKGAVMEGIKTHQIIHLINISFLYVAIHTR